MKEFQGERNNLKANMSADGMESLDPNETPIRVNGKQQIIDMLRYADAGFRETILRGLEKRDPRLARELRAAL